MNSIRTSWFLFGRQSEIPEEYAVMSNFGYYRFYYVESGSCYFQDNNERILLEAGNIYLLPRKSYSLTYSEEKRFEHIWGHFQIDGWQFNNPIKLDLRDDIIFSDYAQLLRKLASTVFHKPASFENQTDMICLFSDDCYFDTVADFLCSLINYIYLSIHKSDVNKKPLDAIIDYINSNLDKDLSNDTLAEMAQYSKAHFIQEFSRIYNISPQKYVIKARMSQAITMLMNNEKIYNISYKVGYDNPKSFARAFKRETGLTPQDYRIIHYLNIHNIQ